MLSIILIIKLVVFYQILLKDSKVMVLAIEKQLCRGKHQMAGEMPSDIYFGQFEPIEFVDFDKIPSETILENDGHTIMLHLTFNTTKPTVKVNFKSTLGVKDDFSLDFLYFQWFEEVPSSLALENLTFPGEFHALFYQENAKDLEHLLTMDRVVIVLAFQVQVNPLETDFKLLQDNLQHVQEPYAKTKIPNHNLEYWLRAVMQNFYLYIGTFQYHCQGHVIFIDFTDKLQMSPAIVKEFQQLKSSNINPLINDILPSAKPKGKVYTNFVPLQNAPPLTFYHIADATNGSSGELPGLTFPKQVGVLFVVLSLFLYFFLISIAF